MIAAALLSTLAIAPAQLPSLESALQNARSALRTDLASSLDHDLRAEGSTVFFGEKGTYEMIISPSGAFAERVASPLGMSRGFDGKTAWEADWSGATRTLALKDRELTLAQMAMHTGAWLDPKGMFDIAIDAKGSTDATLRLQLTVRGGKHKAWMEVDRGSWLPQRTVHIDSAGEAVTTFADWRLTAAGRLPFAITSSEGGLTNTVNLDKVERAPTFIRSPYVKPPWTPTDTRFDPTASSSIEMKRTFTGHILVHPLVDGKDVGWFILDSGAGSMVIDPKVAAAQRMPQIGDIPVVGVGGVVKGHFRTSKTFTLGPITVADLKFVEIDLEQISRIFQTKVAGIAGYDIFRRSVVSLDLEAKTLAIEDPTKHRLASGQWLPLQLDGKHPIVEAAYEGKQTGMFRIDTGAQGTVTFGGDIARALVKGRDTKPLMLGGVGGMIEARQGSLSSFTLAGHRFDAPEATFMTGEGNALANDFLAGNIGQDFLMPFKMVFDYGSDRIAFVPHGRGVAARAWPTPLMRR